MLVPFVTISPNRLQELRARVDSAGMRRKMKQEIEFCRGKLHRFSIQCRLSFCRIQRETEPLDGIADISFWMCIFAYISSQERFDPSYQFADTKWFCKVIVSTYFQSNDTVRFGTSRG